MMSPPTMEASGSTLLYRRVLTAKLTNEGQLPITRAGLGNGLELLKALYTERDSNQQDLADCSKEYRRCDVELYDSSDRKHAAALVGYKHKGKDITWKLVRIRQWMAANGIREGSVVEFSKAADGKIIFHVVQPGAATSGCGGAAAAGGPAAAAGATGAGTRCAGDCKGATAPPLAQGATCRLHENITLNQKMRGSSYLIIPATCNLALKGLAPHLQPDTKYDVQVRDDSRHGTLYECQLWADGEEEPWQPGGAIRWRVMGMGPFMRMHNLSSGDTVTLALNPGERELSIQISGRLPEGSVLEREEAATGAAVDGGGSDGGVDGGGSSSGDDSSSDDGGSSSSSGSGCEGNEDVEDGGSSGTSDRNSDDDDDSSGGTNSDDDEGEEEEGGKAKHAAAAAKRRRENRKKGKGTKRSDPDERKGARAGAAAAAAAAAGAGPGGGRQPKKRRRTGRASQAAPRPAKGSFDSLFGKILQESEKHVVNMTSAMMGSSGVFGALRDRVVEAGADGLPLTLRVGERRWQAKMRARLGDNEGTPRLVPQAKMRARQAMWLKKVIGVMRHLGLGPGDVILFHPDPDDGLVFDVRGWRVDPAAGGCLVQLKPVERHLQKGPWSQPDAAAHRYGGGGGGGDCSSRGDEDLLLAQRMPLPCAPSATGGGDRLHSPREGNAAAGGHAVAATTAAGAALPRCTAAPLTGKVKDEPGTVESGGDAAAGVGPTGLAGGSGGGGGRTTAGRRTGVLGWRPVINAGLGHAAQSAQAAAGALAHGAVPAAAAPLGTAAVQDGAEVAEPAEGQPSALPASTISHPHGYVPGGPPAVQPGELRLCGLTFHPELVPSVKRLMAVWMDGLRRQMERNNPLAEALAIADPVNRQMLVLGVDTPFAAPSVAASNVGLVTAAAAAFRRHKLSRNVICSRLAKMIGLRGEGRTAASPLPESCPPWHPDLARCDDPRRGGFGLLATKDIRDNMPLGVMSGYVLPAANRELLLSFDKCDPRVREDMRRRAGDAVLDAWQFLTGAFSLPYIWSADEQEQSRKPQLQEADAATAAQPKGESPWQAWAAAARALPEASLSMLGYGGLGALVNDPRDDPRAWVEGNDVDLPGAGAAAETNCVLLPIAVRGLVLLVLVTLRPIKAGEQLIRDYGANWWRQLEPAWELLEAEGLTPSQAMWGRDPQAGAATDAHGGSGSEAPAAAAAAAAPPALVDTAQGVARSAMSTDGAVLAPAPSAVSPAPPPLPSSRDGMAAGATMAAPGHSCGGDGGSDDAPVAHGIAAPPSAACTPSGSWSHAASQGGGDQRLVSGRGAVCDRDRDRDRALRGPDRGSDRDRDWDRERRRNEMRQRVRSPSGERDPECSPNRRRDGGGGPYSPRDARGRTRERAEAEQEDWRRREPGRGEFRDPGMRTRDLEWDRDQRRDGVLRDCRGWDRDWPQGWMPPPDGAPRDAEWWHMRERQRRHEFYMGPPHDRDVRGRSFRPASPLPLRGWAAGPGLGPAPVRSPEPWIRDRERPPERPPGYRYPANWRPPPPMSSGDGCGSVGGDNDRHRGFADDGGGPRPVHHDGGGYAEPNLGARSMPAAAPETVLGGTSAAPPPQQQLQHHEDGYGEGRPPQAGDLPADGANGSGGSGGSPEGGASGVRYPVDMVAAPLGPASGAGGAPLIATSEQLAGWGQHPKAQVPPPAGDLGCADQQVGSTASVRPEHVHAGAPVHGGGGGWAESQGQGQAPAYAPAVAWPQEPRGFANQPCGGSGAAAAAATATSGPTAAGKTTAWHPEVAMAHVGRPVMTWRALVPYVQAHDE